jgi:hypothetical protein
VNGSSDATALSAWITAVALELGLEDALEQGGTVDTVLDLASTSPTTSAGRAPP